MVKGGEATFKETYTRVLHFSLFQRKDSKAMNDHHYPRKTKKSSRPGVFQEDEYFPQFRSFDWFCGHSWARGLLFSYDGKDQVNPS